MIKPSIEEAINKQINAELYSAYLYMSMSANCSAMNLEGFANWFYVQGLEEFMHAKKFYDFLISRNGRVKLAGIAGPPTDWKSAESMFEETYKHEQHVTSLINALVDLSIEESDHATNAMLQWFVTEQVEEESNASSILEKIKLTGSQGSGIFMLDQELAKRVFIAAEYQPAAQ
jgi:ferritin